MVMRAVMYYSFTDRSSHSKDVTDIFPDLANAKIFTFLRHGSGQSIQTLQVDNFERAALLMTVLYNFGRLLRPWEGPTFGLQQKHVFCCFVCESIKLCSSFYCVYVVLWRRVMFLLLSLTCFVLFLFVFWLFI